QSAGSNKNPVCCSKVRPILFSQRVDWASGVDALFTQPADQRIENALAPVVAIGRADPGPHRRFDNETIACLCAPASKHAGHLGIEINILVRLLTFAFEEFCGLDPNGIFIEVDCLPREQVYLAAPQSSAGC